ncbi:hypothetical protein SNL152K_6108 [Streptomyces sp. NL15-2K]|nr:hypothetical protein SNL152K_6108 [Streptomyces sp. NL15-2K]
MADPGGSEDHHGQRRHRSHDPTGFLPPNGRSRRAVLLGAALRPGGRAGRRGQGRTPPRGRPYVGSVSTVGPYDLLPGAATPAARTGVPHSR